VDYVDKNFKSQLRKSDSEKGPGKHLPAQRIIDIYPPQAGFFPKVRSFKTWSTCMLGFLGLLMKENMQLEGFFFYMFTGFFAGSVIHYMVAKIFGPLVFGRGFCG
jgi:hypothetical protein